MHTPSHISSSLSGDKNSSVLHMQKRLPCIRSDLLVCAMPRFLALSKATRNYRKLPGSRYTLMLVKACEVKPTRCMTSLRPYASLLLLAICGGGFTQSTYKDNHHDMTIIVGPTKATVPTPDPAPSASQASSNQATTQCKAATTRSLRTSTPRRAWITNPLQTPKTE